MRVSKFLVSRNISIERLNLICEYLFLPFVSINTKVSEESFKLWDLALNDPLFEEWFQNKTKIVRIEIDNAKKLVKELKELKEITNFKNFSPELCQRIINSYLFLIRKSIFTTKDAEKILKIIDSDQYLYNKISLLKNLIPDKETNKISKTERTSSHQYESISETEYKSSYDPYENFHWGGLSGEEAYVAYWNTQ